MNDNNIIEDLLAEAVARCVPYNGDLFDAIYRSLKGRKRVRKKKAKKVLLRTITRTVIDMYNEGVNNE